MRLGSVHRVCGSLHNCQCEEKSEPKKESRVLRELAFRTEVERMQTDSQGAKSKPLRAAWGSEQREACAVLLSGQRRHFLRGLEGDLGVG